VPVPSATAQDEALKLVKEAYGGQYAEATSSSQKAAFAEKLLQTAKRTDRGTANHYALLRVAWDVATQDGDAKLAIQVVSQIAGSYEIDALAAKTSTVGKTADSIRSSAQRTALASVALDLVEEAVAADDYDRAKELVSIGLAAARKAQDWQLVKRIVARDKALKEAAEAYSRVREALAKLDNNPTDPEANQAAGEYFCFVKGDWEKGIPMLALGTDDALKTLARKELKQAGSAEERMELGDAWWDLAQTKDGKQREALLLRAGSWYAAAKDGLSSNLALAKAQNRLNEIAGLSPPIAETPREASSANAPSGPAASAKVGAANKTGPRGATNSPVAPSIFAKRQTVIAADNHAGESGRFSAKNIYAFMSPRPFSLGETAILYQAHGAAAHDTNGTISVSLDRNTWLPIGEWTEADMEAGAGRQNWHRVDFTRLEKQVRASEICIKFEYTSGGQKLNILRAVWIYEGN
jgi:hypothetical protein